MKQKKTKKNQLGGGTRSKGSALKTIFTLIIMALIAIAIIMAFKAAMSDINVQASEQGEVESSAEEMQSTDSKEEKAAESNEGVKENETVEKSKKVTPAAAQKSAPDDNQPLMLGNPTGASDKDDDNYLMLKKGYVLSYNASALTANWAAWHLDERDLGDAVRSNTFRVDDTLPEKLGESGASVFLRVKSSDYQFNTYGFDRGHLCPSADRTADDEINSETFLMTNMVPQSPDNNRVAWKSLEAFERDEAADGNELYIFAGVQGTGGESEKGKFNGITLKDGKSIAVPAYTWKVMIILPNGDGDLSRIDKETEVVAVMIPNKQGLGKWQEYAVTVDSVEAATQWDFFAVLDDEIEDSIEAKLEAK